uniref:HhH-GPD domain-containing protein n=1 Tax=Ignisphaera aggregans TaxID=334771 RepID=A0A7C2Z906_9CREN
MRSSGLEIMVSKILKVDPRLDLWLLLYPSFILPLMDVERDKAVKRWGFCGGLVVKKFGSRIEVEHNSRQCLDYAEYILGFWYKPQSFTITDRKYRELVETLLNEYCWLGIATSPADDIEIFISIYLSQNTDFHRNVLRWVRSILEHYGSAENFVHRDIGDVARDIGKSYQLLNLVEGLRMYMDCREVALGMDDDMVKKCLFRIKGVGPKVFNAYMVYARRSLDYIPIDKNLKDFIKRFDATSSLVARDPIKSRCAKYRCGQCPQATFCTHYRLYSVFGRLGAWLQTVAYVHNKLVCRRGMCRECFLKHLCNYSNR